MMSKLFSNEAYIGNCMSIDILIGENVALYMTMVVQCGFSKLTMSNIVVVNAIIVVTNEMKSNANPIESLSRSASQNSLYGYGNVRTTRTLQPRSKSRPKQ